MKESLNQEFEDYIYKEIWVKSWKDTYCEGLRYRNNETIITPLRRDVENDLYLGLSEIKKAVAKALKNPNF